MLVLTQLGVGATAFEAARALLPGAGASPVGVAIGLAATLLGLAVASLHLGRPQYAFRILLGLRTSWMSREILALGAFAGAASGFAACALLPLAVPELAARLPLPELEPWLGAGAAATGLLAVFCSVMIYADTPRPLWRFAHTAPLFALTCVGLGLNAGGVATLAGGRGVALAAALALTRAVVSAVKLRFESRLRTHLADPEWTPLKKSALLVAGPLSGVARARAQLGWACGVVLPLMAALVVAAGGAGTLATAIAALALVGSTVAEWLERQLFFRASASPAMPGA
jgi:DMSO reductase anchor subunit